MLGSERNEPIGENQPVHRVLPAHQTVCANDILLGGATFGLIVIDQFPVADGGAQLFCAVCFAAFAAGRARVSLGLLKCYHASCQLLRLRLLQVTERGQLLRLDQFLNTRETATVLAADQHHAAAIAGVRKTANELNAVHTRHVDVQEDEVNRRLGGDDMLQRLFTALAREQLAVTELRQHAED